MNYHNITTDDMLNGDGLRVVLWVAGCEHRCPGCQNPETWDFVSGIVFDENAIDEIERELDKDHIKGLTISGGEPLHPNNIGLVYLILSNVKMRHPEKDTWVYTGYTKEQIITLYPDILNVIDVLVDGRFEEDLTDPKLEWVGSSNQRVIRLGELRND